MRKMPFRFARRVRNLEIKTYCPTKKKHDLSGGSGGRGSLSSLSSSSSSQQICPSCVLPIVVAFIFGFTVIQLIVIHKTIVAYKSRSLAFEEVYGPSHNDTKSQGDLLAFSKKFDAAWLQSPKSSSSSSSTSSFTSGGAGGTGGGSSGSNRNNNGGDVGGVEWIPSYSYPYKIGRGSHYPSNINHIWGVACPEVPAKLHGNISINVKKDVSLDELTTHNPQVLPGGKWTPKDCSPRFHVALIIPYRFRWNHLKLLLSVLHPMLRRQQMAYQVFVAEQYGNYTFNKGLLMNAAFLLALNSSNAFDCVIFHDVDLLPETDRNLYGCANSPSHLSVSIDAYGYRMPYSRLVGGVLAITPEHFTKANGYSNLFWGWGGEDDDMYKRLIANQLPIHRPRPDLAKYKQLQHRRRAPNQFINPLIRTARVRFPQDGLTTCHFRLVSSTAQSLFTHFLVDVGQPSYSVLEPNIHLESLVPTSPSSSLSLRNSPSPMSVSNSLISSSSYIQKSYPPHLGVGSGGGHGEQQHSFPSHSRKQQKRSIIVSSSASSSSSTNHYHHSPELSPQAHSPPPTSISSSSSSSSSLSAFPQRAQEQDQTSIPGSISQNKREMEHDELFILSGIARDNDDNQLMDHQSQSASSIPQSKLSSQSHGRPNGVRSQSQRFPSSPSFSQDGSGDDGKSRMTGQMLAGKNPDVSPVLVHRDSISNGNSRGGGKGNNDIPLDPDVPVEQEDDDDDEEDDADDEGGD